MRSQRAYVEHVIACIRRIFEGAAAGQGCGLQLLAPGARESTRGEWTRSAGFESPLIELEVVKPDLTYFGSEVNRRLIA